MIPRNARFEIAVAFCPKSQCPQRGDTTVLVNRKTGLPAFEVTVARGCEAEMQDTLAHELGHVMSALFRSDAFRKDVRVRAGQVEDGENVLTRKEKMSRLAAELEAWDFACAIRPEVDEKEMALSLASYFPVEALRK